MAGPGFAHVRTQPTVNTTYQAPKPMHSAPVRGMVLPQQLHQSLPQTAIGVTRQISAPVIMSAGLAESPAKSTASMQTTLLLPQTQLLDMESTATWQHRIDEPEEGEYAEAILKQLDLPLDQALARAVFPLMSSAAPEPAASLRSAGSAPSATRLGNTSTSGTQGVARCAICHGLLNLFAGRARVQAFAAASSSVRPPSGVVERLLSLQLTDSDHAAITASLCRFHSLHKSRFDLWTRTHMKVKRCTAAAGSAPQALAKVAERGAELGQMEAQAQQAGPTYMEMLEKYVKQLQQDVRSSISSSLSAKAQDFVDNCQDSVLEVDEEIDRKIAERRSQMSENLGRFEEGAREEYWRLRQRRKMMQLKSSTAAGERHNLLTLKRGGYTEHLKEMAAVEQVSHSVQSREATAHVASKVERERGQRESEFDVWIAKMERLRHLQHDQAERDRDRIFTRVDKTLMKWDEEQVIELRQVLGRFQQHVHRVQHLLEKISRGQSVRVRSSLGRSDTRLDELEPFACMLVRSEQAACGGGLSLELSAYGTARSSSALSLRNASAAGEEATGGAALSCNMEMSVFAEFLGAHFPNLRAAFTSIDLTGSGRIACFELQTWMKLHTFPGEARVVFRELDHQRHGEVGLDNLRILSSSFLSGGLRFGRPAGSLAAPLLAHLYRRSFGGNQERGSAEAFLAAVRCSRRIFSFISRGAVGHSCEMSVLIAETAEPTETSLTQMLSASSYSMLSSPSGIGTRGAKTVEDVRAASVHEKDMSPSFTEVGRWAKMVTDPTCSERHNHMRCGTVAKNIKEIKPLAGSSKSSTRATPPRSRPSTSVGSSNISDVGGALEASGDWCRHLRQHEPIDSASTLTSQRCRRGAPPPKMSVPALIDEAISSSRPAPQAGRSASRSRSSSAPRQRSADRGSSMEKLRLGERDRTPTSRNRSSSAGRGARSSSASRCAPSTEQAGAAKASQAPRQAESTERQRATGAGTVSQVGPARAMAPKDASSCAERDVTASGWQSVLWSPQDASACAESVACESAPAAYGSMKLMRPMSLTVLKESGTTQADPSRGPSVSPLRSRPVLSAGQTAFQSMSAALGAMPPGMQEGKQMAAQYSPPFTQPPMQINGQLPPQQLAITTQPFAVNR